jgi:hypothetical protein
MLATALLAALGGALVLITSSETMIAANFRAAEEAFYAADAILERALADLDQLPDWTSALDGSVRSAFTDGPPAGTRVLADGTTIDLESLTHIANCGKPAPCTQAERAAQTLDRPWGANNPQWEPYAYGHLSDAAVSIRSPYYVIAFVGDDPSDNDGDPLRDGADVAGSSNPGRGVVSLRAEAFGPRRAHRVIEATVARVRGDPVAGPSELRVLSWREGR